MGIRVDSNILLSIQNQLVMRIIFVLFIFLCQLTYANGQDVLYKNQLVEDIQYAKKYMKKYHPSFNRYSNDTEKDSVLSQLVTALPDTISFQKARIAIMTYVAQIGCGHTSVLNKTNSKKIVQPLILPFEVYHIDQRIYVRKYYHADNALNIGDEILSINGKEMVQILNEMSEIIMHDGFNKTHISYKIEKYFNYYFAMLNSQSKSFTIMIQRNGQTPTPRSILAMSDSLTTKSSQRYIAGTTSAIFDAGGMSLHHVHDLSSTALLTIKSFSAGSQRKIRKQVFKYLKDQKIQNLIVDLRGNGGGNMFKGYQLISYFTDNLITGLNFGRKPGFILFDPAIDFKGGTRLTMLSFMLNPLQYPSKHGWMHLFPFIKKRNKFDGKVYVLTDGGTFSMASVVAAKLKERCHATIVGEETGGGAAGSAGMANAMITLPNTKIPISFNVYWTPSFIGKSDEGRGVMPQIEIQATIDDILSKKDVVLEKVKFIIQSN